MPEARVIPLSGAEPARRPNVLIILLDDVSKVLEVEGVAAFEKSFDELLGVLTTRAGDLA